jgi:hypothetical protein
VCIGGIGGKALPRVHRTARQRIEPTPFDLEKAAAKFSPTMIHRTATPSPRGSILHPLSSILALILSLPALAQTNIDLMLRPFQERVPLEVNGFAAALNEGNTDTGDDYQLSLIDITARYRLAPAQKFDPRLGASATYLHFDTDDDRIPTSLLDVSFAVGFGVYEDKVAGWQGALTLGAGYAGASGGPAGDDDFFSDGNAWYGKASFILGKKLNKTDGLLFVIDYDGNRSFKPDVPLPGLVYQKLIFGNPDPSVTGGPFQPQLLLSVGVPYASIHWEPIDRLSIDATYLIPDDLSLRIDYDLLPARKTLGVYASFDSRRNSFHSEQLRHGNDRLFFFQRRAEVGFRWTPTERVNLLAALGYAFGQELTEGFDTSDDDKVADIGDRPYVRVGLQVGF